MKNTLMFKNDERIVKTVEKINSYGCSVIFNDVTKVTNREGLDWNKFKFAVNQYFKGEELMPIGFVNSSFIEDYKANYIFLTSKEGQEEIALEILVHELGHIIKFDEVYQKSLKDKYMEYITSPDYMHELDAWICGFRFMIENKIKINDFDNFIAFMKRALGGYRDNVGFFEMLGYSYEMEKLEEILLTVIKRYREVVING